MTEAHKRAISGGSLGRCGKYIRTREHRQNTSISLLGNKNAQGKHSPMPEEAKRKISETLKGRKLPQMMGNKNALGHHVSKKAREAISKSGMGNQRSLGIVRSTEYKKKISLTLTNPPKEIRILMAERQRRKWQEPDYILMQMKARRMSPNKIELYLWHWLEKNYPKEWAYNGDGKLGFVIGGKVPDFININGRKAVIELFGRYWHVEGEEEEKMAHYQKFGFVCIILWEDECLQDDVIRGKLSYCGDNKY